MNFKQDASRLKTKINRFRQLKRKEYTDAVIDLTHPHADKSYKSSKSSNCSIDSIRIHRAVPKDSSKMLNNRYSSNQSGRQINEGGRQINEKQYRKVQYDKRMNLAQKFQVFQNRMSPIVLEKKREIQQLDRLKSLHRVTGMRIIWRLWRKKEKILVNEALRIMSG